MACHIKHKLKLCDCGCGRYPRGADFIPDHDMRVFNALVNHVGNVRNLREVVECYTGKEVSLEIKMHS